MNEASITIDELKEFLDYNSETGVFIWKARGGDNPTAWDKTFNTRFAGKKAVVGVCPNGYQKLSINNKKYSLHRVVWAFVYNEWPDKQIDHINGVRTDNRISNLRSASIIENARNRKRPKSNVSGTTGVSLPRRGKKWYARISVNKRLILLGIFERKMDAIAARKAAEEKYGFHPNHGRAT